MTTPAPSERICTGCGGRAAWLVEPVGRYDSTAYEPEPSCAACLADAIETASAELGRVQVRATVEPPSHELCEVCGVNPTAGIGGAWCDGCESALAEIASRQRCKHEPCRGDKGPADERAPRTGAETQTAAVDLAEMMAALRDPDYLARLAADARQANSVEVDNPFRREIRPRRGTEDFRSPDTKEER